jgi:glycine oxidase
VRAAPDIVVIGAGIIGCAIADELARRGASVHVVDPRAAGMGATQASAGVLAPYIEAHEGTPLLDLAVRSLDLYDEFVARVVTDSGMAVPYRRTGTLDVAFDEQDLRALEANAAVLARLGVSAAILSAAGTRDEEPQVGEAACGALLVEAHGFVGASDLTRALAMAARRGGAHFLEPARVRRVVPRGPDVVVETESESIACASVVLAAGSWSGELAVDGIDVRPPVRPVRGQLLSLAWQGAPLRRVTWSSRCYLVPWDDGTLLVGATVEEAGFDERATADGVRGLLDAACAVAPQARSAGFTAARVGLRPATTDGLPLIGTSSVLPSLMYATGHYRNGILLAPLTAQLVADAMIDRRVDPMLAPLSPARFGAL